MILTRRILQNFSLQSGRLFLWQKGQSPIKIINIQQNVQKVSCGANHTVILGQSGKVYTFGSNDHGQCGHNHKNKVENVSLVQYFQKHNIKATDVICGDKHTLVLDQNGQVYSFGYGGKDRGFLGNLFMNPTGPLGHGNHVAQTRPLKIKAFENKKITRITCGRQFNTAVDSQNNVYNWGNGQYGAFGDGRNKNSAIPFENQYFTYLKNQQKIYIKKVKSSESYSIGLLSDNKLYGWGSNQSGQMGVKSQIGIQIYETVNFPTQVIKQGYQNQQIINFDISENTMLFQLSNNQLWWTGMKMAYKPQKVRINIGKPKLFAAGNRSYAIVDKDNNLYTYGDYIKAKMQQDLVTGIKKANGNQLFGGEIVGIGGEYQRRYAIVK